MTAPVDIAAPDQAREHLEAWLHDLRTTNYPQTHNTLVRGLGPDQPGPVAFCCLGIGYRTMGKDVEDFRGRSLPDPDFIAWLGLDPSDFNDTDPIIDFPVDLMSQGKDDGRLHLPVWGTTASQLNDDWCLTFPQIADVIAYFGLSKIEPEDLSSIEPQDS